MHRISRLSAFLLSGLCLASAAFAEPKPALDHKIPGHYYLQGGREVGSELLLKEGGKFEWMLSYGNVDQSAQGTWKLTGRELVLTSALPEKEPVFRVFEEDELTLRKDPKPGIWAAIVGVPRYGPAPGMEVKFEAKSGKTLTAISDRNGDAIVNMPATEKWTRAGLRRAGTSGDWQWLNVPEKRSKARVAGFAINGTEWMTPAGFKTMQLTLDDKGGLAIKESEGGLRGVYTKQ